ncbi:MAG: hypothetical protein M3310_05245, partial [Actinomycetota bacterium]|nr:hypothetical protein [Actinomycetota bacterium]
GYLARLDRAGVRLRHHLELANIDGAVVLRNVFSGRTAPLGQVATLVLAQGRRPQDDLWRALDGDARVTRVGDVLGPRTVEEAVLEGFLAGRGEPVTRPRRLIPRGRSGEPAHGLVGQARGSRYAHGVAN